MPRLLFRNGRLVFRNGRAQPDDAACRERCCDGGPPGPCCPSLCGETFRICVQRYTYSATTTTRLLGPPPGNIAGNVITTFTSVLDAAPINGQPTNGVCGADALLPLREIRTIDYPSGQTPAGFRYPLDERTEELNCKDFGTPCYPVSEPSGSPSTPLGDLLFQLEAPQGGSYPPSDFRPTGLADGAGSNLAAGTYTQTATAGGATLSKTFTITRTWSFVPMGDGTLRLLIESQLHWVTTATPPYLRQGGPTLTESIDRAEGTVNVSAEIRYIPITNCDGSTGPAFNCDEPPHDCDGDLLYLRAEPCIGQTPAPPPVVFLARNVTACRVIAVGQACYKISPRSPRTNDPGAAYIDFRIIDQFAGQSTCCACMADCDSQAMPSYPCWVNALRNAQGQLVTSPATIGDEPCCCFDDDIITIAQINGEITYPGNPQQIWRLTAPITFRRGQEGLIVPNVVSRVTAPDGSIYPGYPNGYNHGAFNNTPTAACAWRSSLGGFFVPFENPQNGASAQPVGDNLPCPTEPPDGPGLPWRIRQYSISATCDQFVYDAVYDGPGGAVFHANTRVLVQQAAEAENRRCGGKCLPPRVIKPGGGGGDIRGIIG